MRRSHSRAAEDFAQLGRIRAEQRRIEGDREPGDRADPAQPVDASVRRRTRDVTALGEVGEGHPPVGEKSHEDRPINLVDLPIAIGRFAR